jgi:hypothetical protein
VVDRSENSVSAAAGHFTTFAVLGHPTEPLIVKSVAAEPEETGLGEELEFIVTVENAGEARGTYIVPVRIDGVLEHEEEVTVSPGEHEIRVRHREPYAGSHDAEVKGVHARFTVTGSAAEKENWWNSIDVVFNGYIALAALCVALIEAVIIAALIKGRRQGAK